MPSRSERPLIPSGPLLLFSLDRSKYALPLSSVERVLRAVAATSLPKAPDIVIGVFSLRGRILPILDIRKRFGLPSAPMRSADCLIVAHTDRRSVSFPADSVQGVEGRVHALAPAEIAPGLEYLRGVARIGGDIVLIHDLDRFLSWEEASDLDRALEGA